MVICVMCISGWFTLVILFCHTGQQLDKVQRNRRERKSLAVWVFRPESCGERQSWFSSSSFNITGTICIWVPRNEECVTSKNCTDWSLHGCFILSKINDMSYIGELSWESASLHKLQNLQAQRMLISVGWSVGRSLGVVHNEISEQLLGGLP